MAAPKLNPVKNNNAKIELQQTIDMLHPDQKRCWESNLFSEVYLSNDVPTKYRDIWNRESGHFYEFCEQFRNLCEELKNEKLDSWSERTTINRFIKPMLEMLGWKNQCSKNQEPWTEDEPLTNRENGEQKLYKPDLLVVDDPDLLKHIENKSGEAKLNEARRSSIISIEAKYWGRIDETNHPSSKKRDESRADKKENRDDTKSMEFDEQCLKYADILHHDYGILTDGRTWRLHHVKSSTGSVKRNYQYNLWKLMKVVQAGIDTNKSDYNYFVEQAKYFYYIFSKSSLHSSDGSRRLVDDFIADSKKYTDKVEEDLKIRFVSAMSIACNGFRRSLGKNYSDDKIDQIRNVAESHIFNLLFIRYSESKNILPIRQNGAYRRMSLSNIVDNLDLYDPCKEDKLNSRVLQSQFKTFQYTPDGHEIYDMTINLLDILRDGLQHPDAKFAIKGFTETVFAPEELKFLKTVKLNNREMVALIFELTYTETETSGRYQQIAYSFFAPRQLGSIYESFLEFKLEHANEDMAFVNRQWKKANLNSEKITNGKYPTVKKGHLFFSPNNQERKATGSYYTPDCVVQFILDKTLSNSLENKSSKQILQTRICDPAMGSGHFLAGTLDYMAKKYLEKLEDETTDDLDISPVDAKRLILRSCIFGVDINPRAVKLAKMALWLETAKSNTRLEPLDDQIKCTNSLLDKNLWFDEWEVGRRGFDAVIGNPPYLGEKGHKDIFQEVVNGWLGQRFYLGKMDLFYFFFHLGLDILKPDGVIGFITTNYYPTATGAYLLRKDFKERAAVKLLLNLNEVKVFGDASGQHNLITIATKSNKGLTCVISTAQSQEKVSTNLLSSLVSETYESRSEIPYTDLYDGKKLYIRMNTGGSEGEVINNILEKMASIGKTLGSHADLKINTGIMGGCDSVTNLNSTYVDDKTLKKNDIEQGDGVFVLDSSNSRDVQTIQSLRKSKYLKPFYKNSDIKKFNTANKPEKFIIYSSSKDKAIADPIASKHLSKFRPILNRIREINKESPNLWCVLRRGAGHSEVFEGPKIVAPQRSKMNTFGYNEQSWYASADVYFITATAKSDISLKYLLGLLNSKLYFAWLYMRGKRKGESLELYQKPLSEIPIIKFDKPVVKKIEAYAERLIAKNSDIDAFSDLNKLIFKHCGLTDAEIKAISDLYDSRFLNGVTPSESAGGNDNEAA